MRSPNRTRPRATSWRAKRKSMGTFRSRLNDRPVDGERGKKHGESSKQVVIDHGSIKRLRCPVRKASGSPQVESGAGGTACRAHGAIGGGTSAQARRGYRG